MLEANKCQCSQFNDYVQSRLSQIDKFILGHKINQQRSKILQKQIQSQSQLIRGLRQDVKWMQMNMKDTHSQIDQIKRRISRYLESQEKFKRLQGKLNNIQRQIHQNKNKQQNLLANQQTSKQQLQMKMQQQIGKLNQRVKRIDFDIQQLRSDLLIQQNQQSKMVYLSSLNLPTEIVATKKDLRSSIQLVQSICDDRISHLQQKIRKLKKVKRNKKTIVQIQERKFNDYDLIYHRKSQRQVSQSSNQNLKPINKEQSNSARSLDTKIKDYFKRKPKNTLSSKQRHSFSQSRSKSKKSTKKIKFDKKRQTKQGQMDDN